MGEYNPIRKKAGECIMKELELLQADQARGDSVTVKLSTLLMAADSCNFLQSICSPNDSRLQNYNTDK